MTIDDIFEADGDVFDFPSINRGLAILERNGDKEVGKVRYQYMDSTLKLRVRASLDYIPFSQNEDIEYHHWRVREELYERTQTDIELLTFNIFRN